MKRRRSHRNRPPIRVTLTLSHFFSQILYLKKAPSVVKFAAADPGDPSDGGRPRAGARGVQPRQEFPAEQQPPQSIRKSRFGSTAKVSNISVTPSETFCLPNQKDGERGYEFGYQVEDAETATSYGHVESGDGQNVVSKEGKETGCEKR